MPFPAPEAALSRARTAAPRFASCGGRVAAAPTTPSTDHTHRLPLVDLQAADIPGTLTRAGTSAQPALQPACTTEGHPPLDATQLAASASGGALAAARSRVAWHAAGS